MNYCRNSYIKIRNEGFEMASFKPAEAGLTKYINHEDYDEHKE